MNLLTSLLFIVLFILCLSLLIVVHELGHLTAAKLFKVYCFEYSIGFGPKIFSKKRKNGETVFSLRSIPFGGYVSMYGEGVEVPEGLTIPEERSLTGIKKWKRAIILLAGVFMNAVLAVVLFFVSNVSFPQKVIHTRTASLSDSSPYYAQLITDEGYQNELLSFELTDVKEDSYVYYIDKEATLIYKDSTSETVGMILNLTDVLGYNKLSWNYYLQVYHYKNLTTYDLDKIVDLDKEEIDHLEFTLTTEKYIEEEDKWEVSKSYTFSLATSLDEDSKNKWSEMGISFYLESYRYGLGNAIKHTFMDFGNAGTAIFRGLGSLFTSQEARNQVGGIVAIGFVSTSSLQKYGINSFIRIWALISVNLAIMNLLPFPGLDGWQLLVLAVEAVAHKEIPNKVKNVASFIGLVLLFGLMILLVVKDVWTYIL